MESTDIRLSGIIFEDSANGPGIRTTIFTQGCEIHCPGCHNENTWDPNGGAAYTVEDLFDLIETDELSKGITVSGGEPTLQYKQLYPLLKLLKQKGYNLLLFTGKTFNQFQDFIYKDEIAFKFVACFDFIKIGPWVSKLHDWNISFRGSSNQRFYRVSVNDDKINLTDITDKVDHQLPWDE